MPVQPVAPSGPILCLAHCHPRRRLFCLRVPAHCPLCRRPLPDPSLALTALPSPLRHASHSPCSLAIRPTTGHFLTDYGNSSDLHICVTTSHGQVAEFDECGARLSGQSGQWHSCLSIPLLAEVTPALRLKWDLTLHSMLESDGWTGHHYHPLHRNCFDFVLHFLRSLDMDSLAPSLATKTTFCEHLIVPHTRPLARYISLHRAIQTHEVVVLQVTHD